MDFQLIFFVGLTVCSGIGARLAWRQTTLRRQVERRVTGWEEASADEQRRLEVLADAVASLEIRVAGLSGGQPAPVGISRRVDANRRLEALRLIRRGVATEAIAVQVGLSRSEVALLGRVEETNARRSTGPAMPAPGSCRA